MGTIAPPQQASHRRLDHAERRDAVFDQRDIDGEFAVALHEFASAVERIDQPQPSPATALVGRHLVRGLLRQHRDIRSQFG
jgi:hypothetical protein